MEKERGAESQLPILDPAAISMKEEEGVGAGQYGSSSNQELPPSL